MFEENFEDDRVAGSAALPFLPLNRFRLTFCAMEDVWLPAFAGPLWRSVLGPQMKTAGEGVFQMLFEAETPPFIISTPVREAEQFVGEGQCFDFELTLVGHVNDVASVILEGFRLAALSGLGKQRCQAEMVGVETIWHAHGPDLRVEDYKSVGAPQSPAIPPMPSRVCLQFNSPMCLKMKDKKVILKAREFVAYEFFDKLVRRISTLMFTCTDQTLQTNFKHLKVLGRQVEAEDVLLEDRRLSRWSARQNKEISISGITGSFSLDMSNAPELWPYLWLGQWTHTGKNTSMGCGGYLVLPG